VEYPHSVKSRGPQSAGRHTHTDACCSQQIGTNGLKSDYELFNCNNFSIRYWSWNYRGCWTRLSLQLFLVKVFRLYSFQLGEDILLPHCYVSSLTRALLNGQFSSLLPSLEVVAISQAPSPEPNPSSPLPVVAMKVHYTFIES